MILDTWLMIYMTPFWIPIDNWPEDSKKSSQCRVHLASSETLTIVTHHPRSYGETKRINKTIIVSAEDYIGEL